MKLYEQIPIDTWKEIAYKVQRLNISDCSDEEFEKNLKQLEKLLTNSDICLETSSRQPKEEKEIGLASLLQSIYDSEADTHYKKANFYEKIYELSDLEIQSMEFRPVEFYKNVFDINTITSYGEKVKVRKAFTDGIFDLLHLGDCYGVGTIINLINANYILNISLEKDEQHNIIMTQTKASLKNFNGNFPNKKEFMKMRQPKILVPTQVQEWNESPKGVKEQFDKFNEEDLSCRKMLTRTKDYQYYYRQSKNNK